MSKFALSKRVDSIKSRIIGSKKWFEMIDISNGEFTLLEHVGDNVGEVVTMTKEEWRTLWVMLSSNE